MGPEDAAIVHVVAILVDLTKASDRFAVVPPLEHNHVVGARGLAEHIDRDVRQRESALLAVFHTPKGQHPLVEVDVRPLQFANVPHPKAREQQGEPSGAAGQVWHLRNGIKRRPAFCFVEQQLAGARLIPLHPVSWVMFVAVVPIGKLGAVDRGDRPQERTGRGRDVGHRLDLLVDHLPSDVGDRHIEPARNVQAHEKEIKVAVAADLLSLAILTPPGEWGADIVFGNSQRFGVPMGYGGPHAAFFTAREEYKRSMPGRIIGVTKDVHGNRALRMALQTREQHIKREKATSNICTAQALLATMASFFGVYHGPEGIKMIAERVHNIAAFLEAEIEKLGYKQLNKNYFDTIRFALPKHVMREDIEWLSHELEMNFRLFENGDIGLSIDETTNREDMTWILEVFAKAANKKWQVIHDYPKGYKVYKKYARKSEFLTQEVFNKYRAETEMVRYIKRLEHKDISLTQSMISLGSCTMKLNAATEMLPLSWIEFNGIHPFVPKNQARGYHEMMEELRRDLAEITGMADVSLMPNSGAAGEYTGLMVIREYHLKNGDKNRNVALIPSSAHGTNPASAVMAGMKVVVVKCDEKGNIDLEDVKKKAEEYKETLAAIMITYPSTHGVFESSIVEMCQVIHQYGGQVYMDGANMNAQVGLTTPAKIGADVCHLNLHKTFAIPHGGGGPGVGPIAVASHLVEFLPSHPIMNNGHVGINAVAGAPWGSASVLTITYGYIKMMGAEGLTEATKIAILNANYIAKALEKNFGVLYKGENDRVAHELILECRHLKSASGITEEDIAKRLMDFGFHAPTLSFPVHGTLMIEPTESESRQEMDRFIDALNTIFEEIKEIEKGEADKTDNVLKNAPHTAEKVISNQWEHSYSREKAAYPREWVREHKFWVPVGRVDNAWGDRHLICTCGSPEEYELMQQE